MMLSMCQRYLKFCEHLKRKFEQIPYYNQIITSQCNMQRSHMQLTASKDWLDSLNL